ncbi:neuroglian-like isoform X2 [Contarinia nasturtii]|uniref:neuroglian-like isoform X2 n=1 Tax=Contarinia nasturtii TaxID=265458 RepID=UPI0012D40EE2|nr:neuroglian-like isoform X2 [Contarinia nasturtii]
MGSIHFETLCVLLFVFHKTNALDAPKITKTQCHDHDVELSWEINGYTADIDHYTIERISLKATEATWKIAVDKVTETSLTVPLRQGAKNMFRVIAKDRNGKSSKPSETSKYCTWKQDVPYTNPTGVFSTGGVEPGISIISWKAMPESEYNGPGFFYRVFWKKNGNKEWIQVNIPATQTRCVIDEKVFFQFEFKVIAVNELGESNAIPEVHTGYTGEDRPSAAPKRFSVIVTPSSDTHAIATFKWDSVPESNFNGHLCGYKIQIWKANSTDAVYAVTTYRNEYTEKMKINTLYYATIRAINYHYYGPMSNIIEFSSESNVPDQIKRLEQIPFGSTALKLKWEPPVRWNSRPFGYNIYYRGIKEGYGFPQRKKDIYNPNITETKLYGLRPNTKYQLHIAAWGASSHGTLGGEGVSLPFTFETKAPSEPNVPSLTWEPQDPLIGYNGSVRVYWKPIIHDGNPGSYFYVKYRIKDTDEWRKTEYIYDNDYTIVILKLHATYEMAVVSVDGRLYGSDYYETASAIQLVSRDIFELRRH